MLFNPSTRRTASWDSQENAFLGGVYGYTLPSDWVVSCVAERNKLRQWAALIQKFSRVENAVRVERTLERTMQFT